MIILTAEKEKGGIKNGRTKKNKNGRTKFFFTVNNANLLI